jgi:hypothetical protein
VSCLKVWDPVDSHAHTACGIIERPSARVLAWIAVYAVISGIQRSTGGPISKSDALQPVFGVVLKWTDLVSEASGHGPY